METKIKKDGKSIDLQADHREQIAKISAAIGARYDELLSIMGTSLGVDPASLECLHLQVGDNEIAISKTNLKTKSKGNGRKRIEQEEGDGQYHIWPVNGGCYEDPPGRCFECQIEGF